VKQKWQKKQNNKNKLENSCVQGLIPKIKEQTESKKKKRHNSGTFAVLLNFF
jgi:hypothetical protein